MDTKYICICFCDKTLIELLVISKQKKARIYLTNSEIPIHENPFNLLKNQEDNECKVLSNLITLNFNVSFFRVRNLNTKYNF